jgi:hypothetical protein
MELVQCYLTHCQTHPEWIRKNYENNGYAVGTLSDNEKELFFGYSSLQWEMAREEAPVYSANRINVLWMSGSRYVRIQMNMIIDNNDLYQMLIKGHHSPLTLKTEQLEAQVHVESIDYQINYYDPINRNSDQIFAAITLTSLGEIKLLQNVGY